MPKHVILLSDGTGNAASKVWRTNVWRLFQSLDLDAPDQVAIYDDGVGTSGFKPLALLGGAFGWGLKRNVLELYKFVCRNYEDDCKIFAFGFSRGAFTARVTMGLVANQGLVQFKNESELHRNAKTAYRAYRASRYHSNLRVEAVFRGVRDGLIWVKERLLGRESYDVRTNKEVPSIWFIGVWDTVAAYGLPIEEMTRGVSQWLWPLELPDRTLNKKVQRACHALALDEERTTFQPVLWTEKDEARAPLEADGSRNARKERISQVWFPGVHSNVGGGYPDDSLAHIPLVWMMQEASRCDLRFKKTPTADPDSFVNARAARDKDGRLYDSRQGLGGYYRYGPRKIKDLCHMRFSSVEDDAVEIEKPKIHESAFRRGLAGATIYAPIGVPANYSVVLDDGRIVEGLNNSFETEQHADRRAKAQEGVWNLVWKRRVVYFATVFASLHLMFFPLLYQTDRAAEFSSQIRWVSESLRLAAAFIPDFFNWWIDSFATNPGTFLIAVGIVGVLIFIGIRLGAQITDEMRSLWRTPVTQLPELPTNWIYHLRTNAAYQWLIWAMKRYIVPFASVAVIIYVVLSLASHSLFNVADAAGAFCRDSAERKRVPWLGELTVERPFKADDLCWASGVELDEGLRYLVTVTETTPWRDNNYNTDVGGFEIAELPKWYDRVVMFAASPIRRVFLRPWFRMIGRVGSVGTDEYFLDPDKPIGLRKPPTDQVSSTLRPRRSGELFLYVNDAVLALPWYSDILYKNNTGDARVAIRHIR